MTDTANDRPHDERAQDHGFWCIVALRFSQFWDFIDKRDLDKHITAAGVIVFFLVGTIKITEWGMSSFDAWLEAAKAGHGISGAEMAAVLAAVLGPWSLLTGAVLSFVVSFYFKARS